MIKNTILTLIVAITAFTLFAQQDQTQTQQDQTQPQPKEIIKKTYSLKRAYAYMEESLLISDSDNNCTFFIRREPMPEDIKIISAQRPERTLFDLNESMYINAGSQNGLKEGDVMLVIGHYGKIAHPFTKGKLGTHYQKKGLAVITCIYEDRAIIMLKSPCRPVEIGDFVLPYKPEPTLFKKKLIYSLCRIPATPLEGRVLYSDFDVGLPEVNIGTSNFISVDLGEGLVEKGDFLLFYRLLRKDLPPFVIGLGIVIHPESNNSTVKVLDAYTEIGIGDHAAVLVRTNELKVDTVQKEEQKKEEIPIVESLNKEADAKKEKKEESAKKATEEQKKEAGKEEDRMMSDLYFDFDSKVPPADTAAILEKIGGFIAGKSEYVIILRGYCCSIGNDEYNLKLSQERVEAIKGLLATQYKIEASHIETYFYGEKESTHDNSQEVERKKNRLVKIEVVGK